MQQSLGAWGTKMEDVSQIKHFFFVRSSNIKTTLCQIWPCGWLDKSIDFLGTNLIQLEFYRDIAYK